MGDTIVAGGKSVYSVVGKTGKFGDLLLFVKVLPLAAKVRLSFAYICSIMPHGIETCMRLVR